MKQYDAHDIVKKLVGYTMPVGSSHEDSERLENLQHLTEIIDWLLRDVKSIATGFKDYQQHSIIKSREKAIKYLTELRDELNEIL